MTSSNNIEREIVQMYFDAKNFREGVRESIEDLGKLKKQFEMDNAMKSLRELEKASHVDFNPLSKGIEALNGKISVMGIVAATFIHNITNSIINNAKMMFNALVLAPITTGLSEYETQLNAIQTILANTSKAGTTLSDVTSALDELNRYADLTIYNFTQMTKNIGTFTAAGVDLETSVAAIKGIANLAAISGSDANQASTAMYQLSQAISSGTVKLMDWNSVQNAGMGGQVFQDSLLETARVHGIAVDAMIKEQGSFRDSLAKGWLSSDILLETLSKFTGDLSDAQLEAIGYTEEQIVAIQKMAVTANDAATKIKTLTQLKDTLSEALQSGWAETWRYIFGDFEEAKELWGAMGDLFGDLIANSSEARNKMLRFWKVAGGRQKLIEGVFNVIEAIVNVVSAFKEAISDVFEPLKAGDLLEITTRFLNFSKQLKMASRNTETFQRIVRGIAAALDIVRVVVIAFLKPLLALLGGLLPVGKGFAETAAIMGDAIVAFRAFAIETGYFDTVVAAIGKTIKFLAKRAGELVREFLKLDVVQDVISWFKGLGRSDLIKAWETLLLVAKAIAAPFYLLAVNVKRVYEEFLKLKVVQQVMGYFKSLSWEDVTTSLSRMSDSIKELVLSAKNSDLVGKFIEFFKTFDGRRITEFFSSAEENFNNIGNTIGSVGDKLKEVGIDMASVGEGIKSIGKAIYDGLNSILDYLIENADNLDYETLFKVINTGLLSGVVLAFRKIASGSWLSEGLGDFFDDSSFGEGIIESLEAVSGTLTSFQNNIRADTIQKIAISIAILAGALALLTLLDSTKLQEAAISIAAIIGTLFGTSAILGRVNTKDSLKAAATIIGISIALAIATIALKNVSTLDPEQLGSGIIAIGEALAALVLSIIAITKLGGTTRLVSTVGLLLGLSTALLLLRVAIEKFGEMRPSIVARGLGAVGKALAMLVISLSILGKGSGTNKIKASLAILGIVKSLQKIADAVLTFGTMKPKVLKQGLNTIGIIIAGIAGFSRALKTDKILEAAIAMGLMSGSLIVIAYAIKLFGGLGWDEILRGLVAMGSALLIIGVAAYLLSGSVAGAVAILVMSVAITALAVALKLLSTLSWEQLAVALAAVAGVFVILGLAGYLLAPVVPVLLLLGAAMLLIGAGAALMGLGLTLAAGGLIAIAGSGVVIAKAIKVIGETIIELLPRLGEGIALALVNFLTVIAENTPVIIEAFKTIVLGMITAIPSMIPDLVAVIIDLITAILTTIAERLPALVQAGYDILLGFLGGIEDNIEDVVATALGIVAEFIDGIAEGLPDLVDSAFNLLLTFLTAIDDAVEEYTEQIVETGFSIAGHIIDGIVDGLIAGVSGLIQTVRNVVGTVIDAFTGPDGIQAESPSRVFYNAAGDIVDGVVLGLRDGQSAVRDAVSRFSKNVQNGIVPLMQNLASDIDQGIEISPIITPVMDLSNIESGMARLSRSINGPSVLAEIAYAQSARSSDPSVSINNPFGDGGYTFVQYNYSPKALDRDTIYRQSRTLIASRAKRVL